jgi:hypothetical protein
MPEAVSQSMKNAGARSFQAAQRGQKNSPAMPVNEAWKPSMHAT